MTQDGDLESKVRFALEHPASRVDRGTLTRLLGTSDPMRQVIDCRDRGERALLAVLVEGGRGPADASHLLIVGCRMPLDPDVFSGFLDEVEGRALAPSVAPSEGLEISGSIDMPGSADASGGFEGKRTIELVLPPSPGPMPELLKRRGYAHVYTYLTLVSPVSPISPVSPVAERASAPESRDDGWRDVDGVNMDATYACYRDAFVETGSPVSSPEEARAVMLGAEPRPRVPIAGGEVAAVARVAWFDEAAHVAELRFVCRNPRVRGQRIGDRALSEVFRVSRGMGASSMQLCVASTNRAALALYERWGFRSVEREDVFRIAVRAQGSSRQLGIG